MKKKIVAYAFLPVLGISMLAMQPSAAHPLFGGFGITTSEDMATRHANMFAEEAALIGVSVEEVKNAWASGKSYMELAKEKGISQEEMQVRLKNAATKKMKEQLATLVGKGVITQAQADARLQFMQNKVQKVKNGRGFHRIAK